MATEWQERLSGEYAVCLLAQRFAVNLTVVGAPDSLIEESLSMALDELEHARLARDVCWAAGSDAPVQFDPGRYLFETDADPILELTAVALSNLALGETLALRIVHELRQNSSVPAARRALDRIVRDEPRHAALGWMTVDWLLGHPDADAVRAKIEQDLPRWITTMQDAFAGPIPREHLSALDPVDLTWGLAHPESQRSVFNQTLERDWKPRLARRGFIIETGCGATPLHLRHVDELGVLLEEAE